MARLVYPTETLSSPVWAGDFLSRDHLIPGGAKLDAAQFNVAGAVIVTVGVAGAAQGATSIPVAALSGAIPSGTVLRFSADEYARLSSAATAGATSLAVEALVNALESGDTATYSPAGAVKSIPSGTLIGRTIAEREAGTNFGPWATSDDEVFLTAFDITDADINPDVDLYRPGSVVKENLLPGWSSYTSNMKTALRAAYRCTSGRA